MPASSRDLRLDFFRGLALIFIFIDHIPENVLSYFTLQAVQFFDAAEVFIFISGYTAALVYGRILVSQGPLFATARILSRAGQLYVAHIFLFVMFTAEVSYTVTTFNNPMYNDEMRVGDFLQQPHIAIVKALLLQFQPTYLDILPLYIVLLVAFPLILLGLRLQPLIVLVPSLLLYLTVQITDVSVPAYPEGDVWYFNPLAWQLLFTAGATLGFHSRHQQRWQRWWPAILPLAVIVVTAGALIRISWTINGIWDQFPGLLFKELWPINKSNFAPIRLVSFFAGLAIIAAWMPRDSAILHSRPARPVILCGQQSLEIFCLSILLSALGHFVLSEYNSAIVTQLAVNLASIIAMCLIASMLDWYKAKSRTPIPAASVAGSSQGKPIGS
ncbi:MAG TPA: OpgC domain-containing protein [Stellaceae bacterium]|nr:OpgC domain-containing protein [Stellaceae bacterium]